jgi:uncharacterized protein YodC (DUF2158 family)
MTKKENPKVIRKTIPEFKTGDVVQLKSGSQKMTIDNISKGKILCVWSVGDKEIKKWKFSSESLKHDEETTRINKEDLPRLRRISQLLLGIENDKEDIAVIDPQLPE